MTMSEQHRPYAGQTWANRLSGGYFPLQVVAMDLAQAVEDAGITQHNGIELWANESEDSKGFFVGDTSSLVAEGWTKLATL